MAAKQDSKQQGKLPRVGGLKHRYNDTAVAEFLELVFHSGIAQDEHILTWISSGSPGYPLDHAVMLNSLSRVTVGRALYFGTSTCTKDPIENKLYNRKALFKRLHVVVLDDIGTKVDIASLPEDLTPTYIIESSAGNFQYGYVLDEPVDVLEHAEALIQLVYESGFTDSGGKMATKLVRLPEGINGKKGEKGKFGVKLVSSDGPLWSPDRLLEVLDLGVTWAEVLEDPQSVVKQRAKHSVGLTPWSPLQPVSANLDGLVDPVLEWMYENNMVKQETNDWVTISCPWSDQHTSDGDVAGYSPIGRGDGSYRTYRGFKCFHEHCSGHSSRDFLTFIAGAGGPEASVHDAAADLLARFALNAIDGGVVYVKGPRTPKFMTMQAFQAFHPHKTKVYTEDGKSKLVKETGIWLNARNRVTLWGEVCDPTTTAKITTDEEGLNYVNTFIQPEWGTGEYDDEDVDMFYDFINYLIPDSASADYFLDWLACKVQDMGFRGAGIVMVALAQGTGRSTLADMLAQMFGQHNVARVAFGDFIGDKFNDFMASPLIISDETLDGTGDGGIYRAYEKLKTLVDPRPVKMTINPKYGKRRVQKVFSSTILFSNHVNALAASAADRRLYVIENVSIPAPGDFFVRLNAWIERDNGVWARSVWRWLMERKVAVNAMLEPAPMTTAKIDMLNAAKSPTSIAVEGLLDMWPVPLVCTHQIRHLLQPFLFRLGLTDKVDKTLKAVLRDQTEATKHVLKIDNVSARPRLIRSKITPEIVATYKSGALNGEAKAILRDAIHAIDFSALQKQLEEYLALNDL